ncbi:CLUMA_CG005853, isoform A, partial [Clunio marinus]
METVKNLFNKWEDFLEHKSDPRISKYFLMQSPFPILGISLGYLFIVKIVLPKYMKNRKAFDIKNILLVFNVWHMCANVGIFYYLASSGWLTTYNWRCEPFDRSPFGDPLTMLNSCWYFLMQKIIDLIETVILLLGKRFDLVTFYHVVHHFLMLNMVWGHIKFFPGGHATFFGFANSFSHIILYSYLIVTSLMPEIKKSFPWLRQLCTVLAATEIIAIILHSAQLFFKNDCNYPIESIYYVLSYSSIYLVCSIFCHLR